MDAAHSHESATRALIASAEQLDPNSPEFYDACQALIKQSAGRRLAIRATSSDVQSEAPFQRPSPAYEGESDNAAVQEARRRESQVRVELQMLQTELTNVKARYADTIDALEAASERASQARIEFGNAMAAIAERDADINEMRQIMADQDREINELQRLLIQAEEARISDASAILDSLDQFRA
ncbi:chromosome segregation ATPase [Aeromicrobium panaciterrae]|uniref:Chromosome segregation ATPase n=1 Tax=Aeromicrobium panaciterrae TaxID=363861 RepID=A0ABU1UPX3_9ACTN|nr:hypothetical protein [Aeromicrobium panaciterrae]MDR7087231.1 chromosome segregation ATPase [Aeromicrobium panaciterrae]